MATAVIFKFENRHIFGERYCINIPPCPDIIWGNGVSLHSPWTTRDHWRRQLFQIQKSPYLCNAQVTLVKTKINFEQTFEIIS